MDKLIGRPQSVAGAQIKILPPIAFGSAFLNNTPLVAMMIPVIRDLSRASRLPAKQLYLPLSFASIMGGMCTIIGTSTNLLVVTDTCTPLPRCQTGNHKRRAERSRRARPVGPAAAATTGGDGFPRCPAVAAIQRRRASGSSAGNSA